MTQISRYIIDTKVTGTDKWIGSDSETQNTTKNFTPNKLSVYFNENQVIDIGTPIRYRYDILEPLDDRLPGTITFEPQVGTPYNFSSITSFILSKYTLKGNDVSNYLNFLVGKKVLISKADDVNIFGYYELTSLVQNLLEPNFFDVTISYITGNGSIVEDKDYLISLVDGAGGIIPTRTSDLINDGEDGVHPFISALALTPYLLSTTAASTYFPIPTGTISEYIRGNGTLATLPTASIPNLQQVVNIGNGISNFGGAGNASIQSTNFTNNRTLYLNDNSYPTIRLVDNANASHNLTIDLDTLSLNGVSYNWSSIVSPSGFVPYTGANASVNLGFYGISGLTSSFSTASGNTSRFTSYELNDNIDAQIGRIVLQGGEYLFYTSPTDVLMTTAYGELNLIGGDPVLPVFRNAKITYQTLTADRTYTLPNASGTIALTSNTVASVGATSPITSSGGNTPTISTSMDTNKLIGRSTAGVGVMEEITIGSGLSLSAGTLTASGASPLTTKGDLYTYNSTNARLPVGLDTQVLLADSTTATGLKWGSNTAATPTGYYAQYEDEITQTVAVINTGYPIKFRTLDISNGVTVVSDSRITFANTGIYNLQFSVQLQNSDTQEHDVTIWLRKNGVDVAGSSGFVAVISKHGGVDGHVLPSWNYLLDVVAGEYYELVWSATSTQVTMPFIAAGNPPPSTASALFTVTQQSGIMAGTGITAINSLTGASQTLTTGTTGTDFGISSSGTTHTFNLPDASATARGVITTGTQTIVGQKTFSPSVTASGAIAKGTNLTPTLTATANGDTLIGLDIAPTFTSGGFTSLANYAIRHTGDIVSTVSNSYNLGGQGTPYATVYTRILRDLTQISYRSDNQGWFNNANTQTAKLFSTGNLVLQNGGTFTDLASSRLTVNSTTQGMLPPRMTTAQKNAISSPATGLVVYDTDLLSLYQYNGTSWLPIGYSGVHALVKPSAGGSVSVSVTSTALSAQAQTANRLIVSPFIPSQTITCSSLYINVATLAAGSNAQILIYSNLNGKPDTKIYQSANLDCSTTGNKIATTTQTFEAGNIYWIGVHTSSTQSLTVISTANLLPIFTTSSTQVSSFFITTTFGSAPTTFGTPSNNSGTMPYVGITI